MAEEQFAKIEFPDGSIQKCFSVSISDDVPTGGAEGRDLTIFWVRPQQRFLQWSPILMEAVEPPGGVR